jgi:hypothetical protein
MIKDKIYSELESLVGKQLTLVAFSYGDELVLNFGNLIPYKHKKLKHLLRGEYQVGLGYCSCSLYHKEELFVCSPFDNSDDLSEKDKELIRQLEHKTLKGCKWNGTTTSITLVFEDDYNLYIKYETCKDII